MVKHIKTYMDYAAHMFTCSVAQWCPALCNPMDCSQLVSSVHGIFQARMLEWVALSYSSYALHIFLSRLKDSPGFSDSSLFWTSPESPCVCVCVCVCARGCVGEGWGGKKCFHLRFLVCAWSLAGQTHQVFLTFLSVLAFNQPPSPLQASGK